MLTNNQSFILTVHNKGFLISRVIESIKKFSHGVYQLIIVLDGCTDESSKIVNEFKINNPDLNILIIETPDVFETKANNVGLKEVIYDIAIIIQDDMVINEENWNDRLTKPFREFNDVFAVTANCAHNWEINHSSKHLLTTENNNHEWSDILNHVDHANKHTISRDIFAIRQCVNRGPLAINYNDFKNLGFFDETFAPLDMDDHDLCFRMSETLNKVVGCYLIDYISEPNWGGTRINGKPAAWQLEANQKNTRIVFERHVEKIKNKKLQSRKC
jgi:glycosyltransferase involved in cell wall biosynthesis